MTPDELMKSMTEAEVALFICVTMIAFSLIEIGANKKALLDRLGQHERNFQALRQPKAVAIIDMMKQMVLSTQSGR